MAKTTTIAETSIEPEAVTEAPAVEASIQNRTTAPIPETVAAVDPAKLRQLVDMIEANRFAPFDALARTLHDEEGMVLSEDEPHTICAMAGVTTRCVGNGRAVLTTWCNAARRYLLQAEG